MRYNPLIHHLIIGLWLTCAITLVHAGAPLWTFTPLTDTTVTVSANNTATVLYKITNHSKKTHSLQMKAISGVTPITTPNHCPNPFVLGYQESCILYLSINGSALSQDILGGPIVCEQNNPNQCYQPAAENRLHITKISAQNYTLGGSVFGLSGTLILDSNTNDSLTLYHDGAFTFANALPPGTNYQVTIQQQPASQTCTVTHSSGTMTNANISDIVVNCSVNTRQIGGQVSGLANLESLVLKNNNIDDLLINSNGEFTFSTPIAQGASYNVTVETQPNTQTCSVINGSGTAGNVNINTIQVNCATHAYTVGGNLSGLSGTVELQNNNGDNLILNNNGSFVFSTPVADGSPYAVTIATQPLTQTCTVSQGNGTISGANVTNVSLNCLTNTTTLTTSISQLALSVTGLTEYGIQPTTASGLARKITISNTGSYAASNLLIASPSSWPSGTSSTTTCNTTLPSGSSCTITITPGNTATSDGTNPCSQARTAPTPKTIQISADNATSVSTNVVVLNYGCIYQGGFIYAFDDTTPDTSSVGGKVVSMSDQSTSIIWSSNGVSSDANETSNDTIPGIGINSTSTLGSPSYNEFTNFFSTTYTNTPIPFTSSSFLMCNGRQNGACNTQNILTFYNTLKTNNTLRTGGSAPFTASAGQTNANFYAAGLCQQTINGYSDWYLPAICEMGYDRINPINSGCGTSDLAPTLQTMQISLINLRYPGSPSLLNGFYWSSNLMSSPYNLVAIQRFTTVGGSQIMDFKYRLYKVICSRAFTP